MNYLQPGIARFKRIISKLLIIKVELYSFNSCNS